MDPGYHNYEPFYQCDNITDKAVINLLKKNKFVEKFKSTMILKQMVLKYYKYDTFDEYITNICEKLIKEEKNKYGGLGSTRGFMSLGYRTFVENLEKVIIEDMFKSNIYNKIIPKVIYLQQKYKERIYSPEQIGYELSKQKFELATKTECQVK